MTLLHLSATRDPRGRTRVATLEQAFPLRTTAAMHLEPSCPGMAHVLLQNPSGALFDGDDHTVQVDVEADARLHLTTQSATRVARAADSGTRSTLRFAVAAGGYLEHLPHALVPMAGARLRQDTVVHLSGDAAYVGSELLSAGRVAHGERFAYDRVHLTTTVQRGSAGSRDVLHLEPALADPEAAGLLGPYAHCATLIAAGPAPLVGPLLGALRSAALSQPDVLAAASSLPDELGVVVRVLGLRAPAVRDALALLAGLARQCLVGLATTPSRT